MFYLKKVFVRLRMLIREDVSGFAYLYIVAEVSLGVYAMEALQDYEVLYTSNQFYLTFLLAIIILYLWKKRLKIFYAYAGSKPSHIGIAMMGTLYTALILDSFLKSVDIFFDYSKPNMEIAKYVSLQDSYQENAANRYSYAFSAGEKYIELPIHESTYQKFSKLDQDKISVRYYKYKGFFNVPWISKEQVELVAHE